jgi:hypothetical protein
MKTCWLGFGAMCLLAASALAGTLDLAIKQVIVTDYC